MALAPFSSARDLSRSVAEILLPPRRIRPSDAAAEYLRTEKGEWNPRTAPMMIEPLDLLASRRYTGIVYVGPARSGKTFALVHGVMTYVVTCAPGDMQITQMSQDAARRFSRTEVDRAIRHSPELLSRLSPRPRDNNVYDKFFRSGMSLEFAWPSATQHASKTLQYVVITDYDRPENRDDVDGEGTLWDLAYARIRTLGSRGKCLAESSPSGEISDPQWRPDHPHDPPPTTGILSIYAIGTRARWYWPCKHCGEYFQAKPGLDCFGLPPIEELEREVQTRDLHWLSQQFARVVCPACGGLHAMEDKDELNARAHWVHAGERIHPDGRIEGERIRTDIASYWQGGVSAAYQSWQQLLLKYFQALQKYVRTSDEGSLKATTNTDLAAAYLPRAIAKRRGREDLVARAAKEKWTRGIAPAGVRFITAAVDVQKHKFVVLVIGWGVMLESWVIDRFSITASKRPEGDRFAALDPSAYTEDWDVIEDEVVRRTYPLEGRPDVVLPVRRTFCDLGGEEGVTPRAYEFWRRMRKRGLGDRVRLVKGDHRLNLPQIQLTWPDARDRKDRRKSGARGDVPVWLLNVNVLKDSVFGDLQRPEPGPGYIHIPSWMDEDYFDELTVENRTPKGWVKPHGARNEALDLHVYNRAACLAMKAEEIDWSNPPEWARPPDPPRATSEVQEVAQAAPKKRLVRRVARSNYMRR